MSCCGQGRKDAAGAGRREEAPRSAQHTPGMSAPGNLGRAFLPGRPGTVPLATARAPAGSTVTLLARDGAMTSVTGRITGKRYRFQGAGAMQSVDRRDADALVASGAFERVGG